MPRWTTDPLDAPFWRKIDVGLCWEWTGCSSNGYGQIRYNRRLYKAHRLVWELLVGSIPHKHDLDHLCRNRACVNPDHLEPVTRSVNLRRGLRVVRKRQRLVIQVAEQSEGRARCRDGHALSGANLYLQPPGDYPRCRRCEAERSRARRAQRKATRNV